MDNKLSSAASSVIPYDVIPPTHPARTLVLCFDGTGDCFDSDNSNVVQFFSALLKDDRNEQMVYYQAGIGTYTTPQIATPGMAKLSKTLDMMIAWNLDAHVMDGYQFLMQNYISGDKICIFGFSRGAYTARALAGMVHKVGLLPSSNHQQVPFAYKMFTREDDEGWEQSKLFKKAFSMDVDIEFIGVWDTVKSVGLIPHQLPFTKSNSSIKTFRHAMSLDEHRAKFKVNHYQRATMEESRRGTQLGEMPKSGMRMNITGHWKHERDKNIEEYETKFDGPQEATTDVLEVWFAGCHCDVGGGSVKNDRRHNLARIPLRWMIRQCFMANTGIRFHAFLLQAFGIDPESLYPEVKKRPPPIYYIPTSPGAAKSDSSESMKKFMNTVRTLVYFAQDATKGATNKASTESQSAGVGYTNVAPGSILSEEQEEQEDALCQIFDQLKISRHWWLLEVLPMKMRVQRKKDYRSKSKVTVNLGRARIIPNQERIRVHRSVKIRMEAGTAVEEGKKYFPRAKNFHLPDEWED